MIKFKRKKIIPGIAAAITISTSGALCAADDLTIFLDIREQPAGSALMELARMAGTQILLSQDVGVEINLPAIKGDYTLSGALDKILSGTGLTYEFTSDDLVLIEESNNKFPADERNEVEEVVVTGTLIKNQNPASQVQVFTRSDIKALGVNDALDFLRKIPQNYSGMVPGASMNPSIAARDGQGVSAASLRGLGATSTLVLVNGRRLAGDIYFNGRGVNLNSIPMGAVERVEVMLDGASSTYGSDAVGGVINFILRTDYQGGETTVRYEDSNSEANSLSLDQMFGLSWDGGHAIVNLRKQETTNPNSVKAGYASADQSHMAHLGGVDLRSSTTFHGSESEWIQDGNGNWIETYISLRPDDDGTNGVKGRTVVDQVSLFDHAHENSSEDKDTFNGSINAEHDIFDTVTLYADVNFSRTDTHQDGQIAYTRAYTRDSMRNYSTVGVNNRFNDTGEELWWDYRFVNETRSGQMDYDSADRNMESLAYTFGVKVDLPFDDWAGDFSFRNSEESAEYSWHRLDVDLVRKRLQGGDYNEAGEWVALPDEEHLNIVGNGTAQNQAALNGLMTDTWSRTNSWLTEFKAIANGPVMELPGGTLYAGLGVEYREDGLDLAPDSDYAKNLSDNNPEESLTAFFAELSIPLVGDSNKVPFVDSLLLNISARTEEYEITGAFAEPTIADPSPTGKSTKEYGQTTTKIGLSWQVSQDLKVRATRSEGFRAPSVRTLFQAPGVQDPCDIWYDDYDNDGQEDPKYTAPVCYATGGLDIRPERSTNWTGGFDWVPSTFLKGFELSATYNIIERYDGWLYSSSLPFEKQYSDPRLVTRGPDGKIIELRRRTINVSNKTLKTTDVKASYTLDTEWGEFELGVAGNYNHQDTSEYYPGAQETSTLGTFNGVERRKVKSWLSWYNSNMGATLTVNHSSAYENTVRIMWRTETYPVDSYTTMDLTGFYETDNGWRIDAGVVNLANSSFPYVAGLSRPPWDPKRVNVRGRIMYLELSKSYDWF